MSSSEPLEALAGTPRRAWQRRLGARLGASFALVLLLFIAALGVCLASFARIDKAERRLETFENQRRAIDHAAILMREQYIHQAHTLIAFDASHVEHYREFARDASDAIVELRQSSTASEDADLIDELEHWRRESDTTFETLTLPAVARGDRATANAHHGSMERAVSRFEQTAVLLRTRTEERTHAARREVKLVHERARFFSLTLLALAALTATAVGALMTRSIVHRLRALEGTAKRLGRGDLSARMAVSAGDELSELAHSFNTMAADLDHHQRENLRNQKLAAMGQVAAGVAHELNNPLGVILGYVKLLRRSDERDPEALRVIEEEATLATQIVSTLLDLTRSPVLKPERLDLSDLTRESAERLSQLDKFSKLTWRTEGLPEVTQFEGDNVRLRQVIVNLLTNAGEAARPEGEVRISITRTAESIQWICDDSGSGIDAELMPRMTEPFFTTKPDGLGLGLSIVHTIVGAHGGDLSFEASPLGGLRVVVALPHRPEASA